MKRRFIIILISLIMIACSFSQGTKVAAPDEESVSTEIAVATEALPEIPVDNPTPTAEPSPTKEPEKVFQPYMTDFSEAADDWEVIMSEDTNALVQEDGQLMLVSSGMSSAVVSSPSSVTNASEVVIEVDVSFLESETEGEGAAVGIVCGYTSQNEFYGFKIDKEGVVSISFPNRGRIYNRLSKPDDQKSYHLQAICSSTGLGLKVDGEKILQHSLTDFQPGRIGLYSIGSIGWNSSTSKAVEIPNKAVFDNFSVVAMQAEDEWVYEPIDPFDYLSVKEVIYNDDFTSSGGAWSYSDAPRQMVKLDNGELVIYTDSEKSFPYAKLNSVTGFASGVMMETDFTLQPESYKYSLAGFVCDINGDWTNFYSVTINMLGVSFSKYSNGGWKGYAGVNEAVYTGDYLLEIGKTYHLTGICGGGYLALLIDDVPQLVMAISEQQIHSIILRGGLPNPAKEEGEGILHFDNFKLTRLEPINN